MGRLAVIALLSGLSLDLCDDPVGPQPDQPIRPPAGYVPDPPPPLPPGLQPPPQQAPAAAASPAKAEAPAAAPADPPKCPKGDPSGLISARAKPGKDKKHKSIELKLTAKSGAPIQFKKVTQTDDGAAEEVKAEGPELTATVVPASAKAKVKLTVLVQCGWEDRTLLATVDAKGATLREVPPPPEPGFLNLVAEPGLRVSASGKELGVTPLRQVALAPGKYQLKLQPAKGKPRTLAVEIRAAETSTVQDKKK
ncbi:MAG: hypothetical protein IPJ65_00760 [Archangiaceae bacterium]|nr:hypothetical protein [Archangiaceae bacterium]